MAEKKKYTYCYYLPDHGMTADDPYEVDSVFGDDSPYFVAEDAAKNYHDEHDGWEAHWPLAIVVFSANREREIGRFSVDRESVLRFHASRRVDSTTKDKP